MNTKKFNAALKKIGSTQTGFASIINVNARTVRRWALGEAEVPTAVAMLLNLMLDTNSTAKDLRS
jgi:DNA-binding transcriptional regulator YiaG